MSATGSIYIACLPYLQSTVPSLSTSSRSPAGSLSPSTSSIQLRTSLAAFGVYLSIRSFLMSWSRDVTDAMVNGLGANRAVVDVCARGVVVVWIYTNCGVEIWCCMSAFVSAQFML
jgi:hypothetical protein